MKLVFLAVLLAALDQGSDAPATLLKAMEEKLAGGGGWREGKNETNGP